jgi:hypothetical protein
VLGMTPASLFLSAFTITMNRIVMLRSLHSTGRPFSSPAIPARR